MASQPGEPTRSGKKEAPGRWGFLLAHHFADELDRCWRINLAGRRVWICARCSGLYPALLVVLVLQLLWPVPRGAWDIVWLGLPGWPALVDWARHRLGRSSRWGNGWRSLSGVLLGVSLSRTVYLNMIAPFCLPVVLQLLGLAVFVLLVEVIRHWRLQRG